MNAARSTALLAALPGASPAQADPAPVQVSTTGLGVQRFVHQQTMHVVDAAARLCFVRSLGESGCGTRIPCQRLHRRAGRDQVIGWSEDR